MGEKYGWKPDEIANLSDEQLYDLCDGLHEGIMQAKAQEQIENQLDEKLKAWRKEHGSEPMPIVL